MYLNRRMYRSWLVLEVQMISPLLYMSKRYLLSVMYVKLALNVANSARVTSADSSPLGTV